MPQEHMPQINHGPLEPSLLTFEVEWRKLKTKLCVEELEEELDEIYCSNLEEVIDVSNLDDLLDHQYGIYIEEAVEVSKEVE